MHCVRYLKRNWIRYSLRLAALACLITFVTGCGQGSAPPANQSPGQTQKTDIVEFLQGEVDAERFPLHHAVVRLDLEKFAKVLGANEDIESPWKNPISSRAVGDGWTALHVAAYLRWEDGIEALLEAGADPLARTSHQNETPLHLALGSESESHRDLLLLIDAGSDLQAVNSFGTSVLLRTMKSQRWHTFEVFSMLLDRGAKPMPDELSDFLYSAMRSYERERMVKLVLSWEGLDVNATPIRRGKIGWKPWHQSAEELDYPLMRSLLELGADPMALTPDNENALHLVLGTWEGLLFLVRFEAKKIATEEQQQVYIDEQFENYRAQIQWLVELGLEVNQKTLAGDPNTFDPTVAGETPLDCFVRRTQPLYDGFYNRTKGVPVSFVVRANECAKEVAAILKQKGALVNLETDRDW